MKTKTAMLAFALWQFAGCENVSPEKIEAWKGTIKGPAKLEAAFLNKDVSPGLRALAAVALFELGKADVVETALPKLPEKPAIVSAALPLFTKALASAQVDRVRDGRDGLFVLKPLATAAEQAQIDAAMLPSLEAEMRSGRAVGGRHSLDQHLGLLGPSATPTLAKLLSDPKIPFVPVSELIARTGDAQTRDQAGKLLIQRFGAGEMQGPMWQALAQVGGATVTDFLKRKVETGREAESIQAAQVLQGLHQDPTLVPFALRLAGDPRARKGVRDEMFGLAERLGGPQVRDGLIRIIATDTEELVRYRAYEAALGAGRGEAVQPALEAFSLKQTYKRDDVVDYLVKDIQKLGPSTRPFLLKALGSGAPLARLVAVMALEHVGAAADAQAVERLFSDGAIVKGFGAGETVGKEAARVAAILKNKVK